MDKIDLKMKICESSMEEDTKNKFLSSVDSFYESKNNKTIDKADANMWKQSLNAAGNTFKQQTATIKQLEKGTNAKGLQRKIREARKTLAAMDDAISGVTGNQVFQAVKSIMVQAKFDPNINNKASTELKNAKKIQGTDPYNYAASRLINLAGDWLNNIDNGTE